ncbi:hypothetical protein BT96DRAFT_960281 [Gymnopus androsaceus JB14]|uniref:Uncharacterized protein n=1 Tax=Gymnopus androsaceus JB14 TaxID=1447944 RepID=A0A6A4GS55_9AGAR|nr:hypothetical protein BT96DRAFT_960281 [Gymnopus androsaceus JB14]
MNTNDFVGSPMELTIVKTLVRTANLRHWLHRPDCPEAVRQLKVLFNKCFVPVNAPHNTGEFTERKGAFRAYAKHNGVNFSPHTTHKGNANIIYRPMSGGTPLAGQIQRIENIGNTDIIDLDDIVAHAACYNYSYGRSVMLNLSR